MTLPLATTTITIESPGPSEPYEPSTWLPFAAGIPAHIGDPSGSELLRGGSQERIDKRLGSEPIAGLTSDHRITDDVTGDRYEVVWVDQRVGLGLDHTVAGLRRFRGTE